MSGDLKWRWCSRVIIKIANPKWIILNRYKNRTVPWPKCFFISFAETFICFPLSKFQKWIDSFHLYIGVRLFLTLIVCDNTVGFRADKCRFRGSNGDKKRHHETNARQNTQLFFWVLTLAIKEMFSSRSENKKLNWFSALFKAKFKVDGMRHKTKWIREKQLTVGN